MKKLKLIYNPVSGDGHFKNQLDFVIEIFQEKGYFIEIFRTNKYTSINDFLKDGVDHNTMIAVSGGDGTVNQAINSMMKNNIMAPLGIFPMGTSNDLANYLGMPRDLKRCCNILLENHQKKMDIGQMNDQYFINVVSGGLIANVPQSTDIRLKNTLGKLAYYLKGLGEIPSFQPISISLKSKEYSYEGEVLLFLVLNSQSAGSFRKIAPQASICDGKFDVLLFKHTSWSMLARLFVKLLRGDHIKDPNVVFFQTDELCITSFDSNAKAITTDMDGEIGPNLPVIIRNKYQVLNMIVSKEKEDQL